MLRALVAATAAWLLAAPAVGACRGDCDGDGAVTIAELVRVVAVVLGDQAAEACAAADADGDGAVAIADAVAAVRAALDGCAGSTCAAVLVANQDLDSWLDGPGLAVHPDGSFDVVTTRSQATDIPQPTLRGEVTVHRFAADGQRRGETRLAERTFLASAPRLARLPSGGGVVAWEEAIDGDPSPEIFAGQTVQLAMRRFGASGAPTGSVVLAARPDPGQSLSLMGVSADGAGTALLLWLDVETREDLQTVYRSRFRLQRPDGLGAQQPGSCITEGGAFSTGAAMGVACGSWDPVTSQFILQIALRAGEALQPIVRLPLQGHATGVAAAANADRVAVVWDEALPDRRRLQIVALDGTTLVGPLTLPRTPPLDMPPVAIALHANGEFAIASAAPPVAVQRYAADGSARGAPLVLGDASRADRLALVASEAGDLLAAWRDGDVRARLIPATATSCD